MEEGKVRRERKSKRREKDGSKRVVLENIGDLQQVYMYGLNNIILTIIIPHTNMPYIPHHQQEERKITIVDEIGSPICGLGWMLSTTCFPLLGVAGVNLSGSRKEFPRVFACFHTGICVGDRATRSARLCTSLPIHPSSRSQPRFDLGALHKILCIPTRTPTAFPPSLFVSLPCSRFTSHLPHLV